MKYSNNTPSQNYISLRNTLHQWSIYGPFIMDFIHNSIKIYEKKIYLVKSQNIGRRLYNENYNNN